MSFLLLFLAGLVDGFNPCAFSMVILLAGILATGGRQRSARVWGGAAFCLSSYLTYLALGLGLLQILRAMEGLRVVWLVVQTLLSLALFVLAFLSVRDAFRYRRVREPSVITLQLPSHVKELIRVAGERSWRGPTVVLTGLVCGFFVTLLDSLCTGQIYVPLVALLAGEPSAIRAFAGLALYNIAFILPLLFVFVCAAFGADAARLSNWSKKNVFPAKLALGFLFLFLAILILPKFGSQLAHLFS